MTTVINTSTTATNNKYNRNIIKRTLANYDELVSNATYNIDTMLYKVCIEQYIAQLSPTHQSIVKQYIAGYTPQEIATKENISERNIYYALTYIYGYMTDILAID